MDAGYLPVPPTLAPLVQSVWFARGTREAFASSAPIAPDGCVEIVFNLGAPFRGPSGDGLGALQPADLLVGQMTRPVTPSPTGSVDLLGLRFRPSRAGMLFRVPMRELQDRMTPLSSLLGGGDDWLDDLRRLTPAARLARVTERLAARIDTRATHRLRRVEHALQCLRQRSGCLGIDALARTVGVSRRHLEREFQDHVGVRPKTFARILRVQAALRALDADPRVSGADIAMRLGFSDQAHLIRECRAIAGVTPSRLSGTEASLATLMREDA